MARSFQFARNGFLAIFFSILVFHGGAKAQGINISLITNKEPNTSGSIAYGDVWAEGNIACMGIWQGYNATNGIWIYDISNPANPVQTGIYTDTTNSSHNQFELGVIRNKIGYFGSWSGGGLHIVSLSNSPPVRLSKISSAGGANGYDIIHTVFLERNFLYEAAHVAGNNTVKVIDVSNPFAPVFVRDIVCTNAYKVHQITTAKKGTSTILYTSDFGNGGSSPGETDIWDVSNVGTQPAVWLGRIVSGASSHSSWPTPDGNTLIVAQEFFGGDVRFYDISNPAAPVLQTTISTAAMGLPAATPHNPVVIGNLLYLSWYQNGIQIFDITDRTRPVRIGTYDTFPGTWTTSFEGNWGVFPMLGLNKILLSDIQSGFYILNASAVLTGTNNYPPFLVSQPTSLTVTQGVTATFNAIVTGSSPSYQWKFNGANIPGATGSSLVLSNAQPVNAGNYTVQVTNAAGALTSSIASLSVLVPEAPTQTVFFEDFDSASSSNNWVVFDGSANAISDYTVDWSYNYASYFSGFNGMNIPPAPNSTNGTTRGLRLTVNNNDTNAATAGVSLYRKNANFSGAYKLKFDMWINYPGGAGGGTGSTEYATFGINHAGTRVNWASGNPSDGTWFAVDGEGGDANSNKDYRAYEGTNSGTPTLLTFAASGFSAAGAASANNSDSYFQSIFPSPTYETAGAPGKRWTQVEISRDTNNILKWKMNDHLIAQRTQTSSFTNGTIMIGFMDIFASIASPAADAFVLFDNVRVEAVVTPTPPQISASPQDVAVYQGQDATFSVAATGFGTLNFQWRFNGADISGATANSLTISNAQPEQVGDYSVLVSNSYGTATSSSARLTILDSPYISAVQATPGGHGALISWNTSVPADSQVQFDPANAPTQTQMAARSASAGFSQASYTDTTLSTNHTILLSGLSPATKYNFQVVSSSGTNSYVSGVYSFTTAGAEIIVDNPAATYTGGVWTFNATVSADKYLTDYNYAFASNSATATATFRPNIPVPGNYDVYVWYPQGGNRCTNAPYQISYNGGAVTVPVNQQVNGGGWRLIGSAVPFAAGTSGYVRVSNNAKGGSVVMSDAVRFVYVDSQDLPTDGSIPAWWANYYFGNPYANPNADADGDGVSNGQEYILGTSPISPNQKLDVKVFRSGDSANVIFSPYLADRSYTLLHSSDLSPNWTPANTGAIVPDSYGEGVFSLSVTNPTLDFFRLSVQLNPGGASRGVTTYSGSVSLTEETAVSPYATDPICGPNRAYVRPRVAR